MSDFVLDYRRCKYGHVLTQETTSPVKGSSYRRCKKCHNLVRRGKQKRKKVFQFASAPVKHPETKDCPPGARILIASSKDGITLRALIDAECFEELSKYTWSAEWGYLISGRVFLHRSFFAHIPSGLYVDHINGDPLDNRICNLRLVTPAQNSMNRKRNSKLEADYKGIHRSGSNWRAVIRVNRKTIHLGSFKTQEEAARAYDAASERYHGEYGRKNFDW